MTFIDHDKELRTLYISKAGNDNIDENESPKALRTFEGLISRLNNLNPLPSQSDQAAIVSLSRGRYDPSVTVEFLAWTQVNLPTVTVADGNMASGPTYKASSTSGVVIQGVTSTLPSQTAYSFDGTSRSGIEADAITSLFGGRAVEIINGAAGSFIEIGQTISDGTCVHIETNGDRPSIANCNVVDMIADGAIGFYVDVADGIPCFMKGNGVRFAASPFGGPVPTTGTALQIEGGDSISYNYQLTEGDIKLNAGSSTIDIQHYRNGDIEQNLGTHTLRIQVAEGNINMASGTLSFDNQSLTGDISIVDGNFNLDGQNLVGDITVTDGLAQFNHQLQTGTVTFNGGICLIDCNAIAGNFVVNPGALVFADIFAVTGSVINFGGLNGIVNGIRYGSYIEGSDNIVTGLRNGNIQGSYDEPCLRLSIDTTNDTITAISCGYRQNPNNSRTVGFRVIDSDTSTVYWEATNVETTSSISHIFEFDLVADLVNSLPANQVVNLLVQAERVSGNGTQDANAQIEFTRV